MALTHTRTHTNYWDHEEVDEKIGGAFRHFESDYLDRQAYIPKEVQVAMEARLNVLRSAWALMLEPVP